MLHLCYLCSRHKNYYGRSGIVFGNIMIIFFTNYVHYNSYYISSISIRLQQLAIAFPVLKSLQLYLHMDTMKVIVTYIHHEKAMF